MQALSTSEREGLIRLGNQIIPGDEDLPSFEESGCVDSAYRVLPYLPEGDLKDLKLLLLVLSAVPGIIIKFFLWELKLVSKLPSPFGSLPRMMLFGIKGLVMTLYYSGTAPKVNQHRRPLSKIGYDVSVSQDSMLNEPNSRE